MTRSTDLIRPMHAHACHAHSALDYTATSHNMRTETDIVKCLSGQHPLLGEEAGPDAGVRLSKLGVL